MRVILESLTGSRAHGLHENDSDWDWRSVYIEPTEKLLSLNYTYKGKTYLHGDLDSTSYELGHFLKLACKCNPSILEVIKSPDFRVKLKEGEELLSLFPYMWNPKDAYNAHIGYSHSLKKKMDGPRRDKYIVAYFRTLRNLETLFMTGDFNCQITDKSFISFLKNIKKYGMDDSEFAYLSSTYIETINTLKPKNTQDLDKINNFLLRIRKENFNVDT